MGQKEFSIKLNDSEIQAVRDHLQTIINIDEQITQLVRQTKREKRSLEMAWAAAFYRNSKSVELPEECPPFLINNRTAVTLEPDGTARWTEGSDGEQ